MRLQHYVEYNMERAEEFFVRFNETSKMFWLDETLKQVYQAYGLVLYATAEGIPVTYSTEELVDIQVYLEMLRVTR